MIQTTTKTDYSRFDFPVSLQKAFTADGFEIPKARAVVRGDTKEPIAVVSTAYRLVTHSELIVKAQEYFKMIGEPEAKFFTHQKGARLVGEFTFKDKSLAVRKNEIVGLRLYVDNNYNARGSIKIRVGAICMWCLNGAVNHRDVFEVNVRHVGNSEINFPAPEQVLESYQNTVNGFKRLSQIELERPQIVNMVEAAAERRIISKAAVKHFVPAEHEATAWGVYNYLTYQVTHKETSRATPMGRINRLNQISRLFDETYPVSVVQ